MKFTRFVLVLAVTSFALSGITGRAEENEPNETRVFISPSGAFWLELNGSDAFVVSQKDPSQKVKGPMPGGSDEISPDDEFYFSPNDEWLYGGRHGGSCLRDGDLYRRSDPTKIEPFANFNEMAWKNGARLKMITEDYSASGDCAMTFFVGWSGDSRRLLIGLMGGDKRRPHSGYLYFNTGTKEFETTSYLKKLSTTKSATLACAEPTEPLSSEPELKARAELAYRKLNEAYAVKFQKMGKDRISVLRDSQRAWVKARDAGLQIYLATAPAAEKERRKLQFLSDVALARTQSLSSGPGDEEPMDFWERISASR
jgi:uncharacterized protein YecT (DUF1311 family)